MLGLDVVVLDRPKNQLNYRTDLSVFSFFKIFLVAETEAELKSKTSVDGFCRHPSLQEHKLISEEI